MLSEARLVAKGCTQREWIAFYYIFYESLVKVHSKLLWHCLHILNLELQQMDVKTVFFNVQLFKEVYMSSPRGGNS